MKTIHDFPNYAIDKTGKVINMRTKRVKAQQNYHGYQYVQLHANGKTRTIQVHRLVAEAFIPNPNNYPCVNHKDENKANNHIENLEWCSYKYNNEYGVGKPTLNATESRKRPVLQYTIDGDLIARYESACEANRKTNIGQQNISRCCLGRKGFNTAGGYIWKFDNQIKPD